MGSLSVTLGGDLTATKKVGEPMRMVGDVETIRGTYDFQGRRFDIVRGGTIRFEGLPELNPTLNIQMNREIQGVQARVHLRGQLREPLLSLSSTPPQEEADILALIVFNQPINELGQGEQSVLATRAQSLATGAVAGRLAQSIGSALNLDTFEITVGSESGSAGELTLGQQVGRNLFVKLVQGLGDGATTNVVLEYEFLSWLRLQSNFMQESSTQQSAVRRAQGSGADLIVLFTK
jgi:translocation and assembly module TamB